MRILYDNATDGAIVTASSAALPAANLLTETKSEIWRSTANTATLTLNWASPRIVHCAALIFCNLTSTATIRVKGYSLTTDTVPLFDHGPFLACAYAPLGLWNWGMLPLGVNAYSYGGGTYAMLWFDGGAVEKLEIILDDTENSMGYLESSRVVTGSYWQPSSGAQYGSTASGVRDLSNQYRTEAGDLKTTINTNHRTLQLDCYAWNETDRSELYNILRTNALLKPVLVSLLPENANPVLEQSMTIYGKLVNSDAAMTAANYGLFTAPLNIEEV